MRKVYVSFKHGLRVKIEGAEIYRKREGDYIGEGFHNVGETLLIRAPKFNLIVFKGNQGYILKSPRLWRRPVPVQVSIQ